MCISEIIINSWQLPFTCFPNKYDYYPYLIGNKRTKHNTADPFAALTSSCIHCNPSIISYFTFSCVTGGIIIYYVHNIIISIILIFQCQLLIILLYLTIGMQLI